MGPERVLVVGLDGFDVAYAEQLLERGSLPALRALRQQAARFLLDHGAATRTGLAWEHFISGRTPEAAGRAGLIAFDPETYDVAQEGAHFTPFLDDLDVSSVIFDVPYADLARGMHLRGVVGWGAHDPGVLTTARPRVLCNRQMEVYPAHRWMYALPWPSPEATTEMGVELTRGIECRTRMACDLLTRRVPDWDVAIVNAGEPHSAAEAFWHGVDATHPLNCHASAPHAADALRDVYRQVDRFVGALVASTAPERVVVFSMGGMGPNNSDIPSMVLLPELVLRWAGHGPLLSVPDEWGSSDVPVLPPDVSWAEASATWFPPRKPSSGLRRRLRPTKQLVRRVRQSVARRQEFRRNVSWQPATRYREWWPQMRAFALPSYYDGRIRLNLRGREAHGVVDVSDYEAVCDELEGLVNECRDPRTGEAVVAAVERPGSDDPFGLSNSHADLVVVWRTGPSAITHPDHGVVGPVPYRRTGGHTGRYGFAYVVAPGVPVGDQGVRSAFDVAPTVCELAGRRPPPHMCGSSMVALNHRDAGYATTDRSSA